jgi:alpha-tubulin suppressor-like RCC1 family protein
MNGMLHGGRRQHYLGAALLSLASMLGSCTAAAISCVSPGDAPTLANQNQKTCLGAARFHALWRKDDGSLAAWGYNQSGQIGDGNLSGSIVPGRGCQHFQCQDCGWRAIPFAGAEDGWDRLGLGLNSNGQLGDGTGSDHALPVKVPALSAVVSLASGDYHALAVRNDGTVWAWGFNGDGQLGDNTDTERLARSGSSG